MRLLLILLLAGPASWNFEKDEPGRAPAGFQFETTDKTPAGSWVVQKEGDSRVLAQVDTDKTKKRFALALVAESSLKDLKLSVRGRPVSGEIDQCVGLVWRCQDADNYYVARTNVLESNVRLYRVVKGVRTQFAGKEGTTFKTGEWHTLSVEHKGSAISVSVNGEKLFDADDKTFAGAGRIGLWTKADSVTQFDDLKAEELK